MKNKIRSRKESFCWQGDDSTLFICVAVYSSSSCGVGGLSVQSSVCVLLVKKSKECLDDAHAI